MTHFRFLPLNTVREILVDFPVAKATLAQIMEILNDLHMVPSSPPLPPRALVLWRNHFGN